MKETDKDRVVEMDGQRHTRAPYPVTDFWFAHVDMRLSQIEIMLRRLEWQVWLIVCGAAAMLVLEIVQVLQAA